MLWQCLRRNMTPNRELFVEASLYVQTLCFYLVVLVYCACNTSILYTVLAAGQTFHKGCILPTLKI